MSIEVPARILDLARPAERVVVLTGAGMSAESGVPTFRDIATGLWSRFSESDLATAEALAEHPATVWAWYAWRATTISHVSPNAGHAALATWQRHRHLEIVTQNVDDLHERAGATVLSHVHGSIFDVRCAYCSEPGHVGYPELHEPVERIEPPACQKCGSHLRPGVVLFNEMLPAGAMESAAEAIERADLVLVVGTSNMVYPAAMLPELAVRAGIPVVEVNPAATALSTISTQVWRATAATALPALVEALGI